MSTYEKINNIPTIEANLFIPIGNACRPAHWLRERKLRKMSFPFDWMMCFNFNIVLDTLKNGTDAWFDNYEEDVNVNKKDRVVKDIDTGMVAMHDFHKNAPINEQLKDFKNKYKKRCNYLVKSIEKVKNICFVCNRSESIEEIKDFLIEFSKLYKDKNITLVNIRHNENNKMIYEYSISQNIKIYDVNDNDINENGSNPVVNPKFWVGNKQLWNGICDKLVISLLSVKKIYLFNIPLVLIEEK